MRKDLRTKGVLGALSAVVITLALAAALSLAPPAEGKPPGGGGGGGGGGETPPLPTYQIVLLGTLPDGSHSYAYSINANGDVVGRANMNRAGRNWQVGFASIRGADGSRSMINLQDLFEAQGLLPPYNYSDPVGHARVTDAYDINDVGQIVGKIQVAAQPDDSYAFCYTPAKNENGVVIPARLDPIPPVIAGGSIAARAINNKGAVTGYLSDYQPFVWTREGGTVALGWFEGRESWGMDINDNGQIAGRTYLGYRAWRYTPGSGFLSLGAPKGKYGASFGYSINDRGDVAGGTFNGFDYGIFRYTDAGGFKQLGTLGGAWSDGGFINKWGDVVAHSETAAGEVHLCLYTDATGLFDLTAQIVDLPAGFTDLGEAGINGFGEICGTGTWSDDGFAEAFVLIPIPSL